MREILSGLGYYRQEGEKLREEKRRERKSTGRSVGKWGSKNSESSAKSTAASGRPAEMKLMWMTGRY